MTRALSTPSGRRPVNDSQGNRFNYIYSELVKTPDDLLGLFAYSIYKKEKIEYIKRFQEETGKIPMAGEDLADFHRQSMARCDQYRCLAEQSMEKFQGAVFASAVQELDRQYSDKLEERVKSLKPSWFMGIAHSLIGSLLYTISLGAVVLIILSIRYGFSWIVTESTKMLTGQ